MDIKYYIFLSIALFVIGIVGVLTRRNAIIIFMCVELMLNAVNILLTALSAYRADAMPRCSCSLLWLWPLPKFAWVWPL